MVQHSTAPDLTAFHKNVLPALDEWARYVFSVADEPPFSYSIGLFEHFQPPEMVLLGLDSKRGHAIIKRAGGCIREGHEYDVDVRYSDLLKECA